MIAEHTVAGIALANLDHMAYYRQGRTTETDRAIGSYVYAAIKKLPWYSGLPVRCLLIAMGLGIMLITGRYMDGLTIPSRQQVFRIMQRLPLFEMVNKLVITLTYLRLFDVLPMPGTGPE